MFIAVHQVAARSTLD